MSAKLLTPMANNLKTELVPNTRSVFLVEDHPAFREGLVQILKGEPDLTVCGEAGDAAHAFEEIGRLQPDLALVDITLPGKSGLELIKDLRAVNKKIRLLVVSMHDEALYADRVLRAGGDGYIMKQEDPDEIIDAIRDVLAGHIYVSEAVMEQRTKGKKGSVESASRPIDLLSDVELEILGMLGRGSSNHEIARAVKLSVAQVGSKCAEMKKKLGVKRTNELIRYAVCWVETGAT